MKEKGKGYALVTGAAKRIGRSIALCLAGAGWDIAVHYNLSKNEAEATAREIRAIGRDALPVQADLADLEAVETLFARLAAQTGDVTALVNNAAMFERDEKDPAREKHNRVNFESPRILTERLFSFLPPGITGSVVNLLDAGPVPEDVFSAYLNSKKKLRAATIEMAKRMAPHVRINAVAPGPSLINPRESKAHFEKLVASTPLGVEISPETIAASVLFLIENSAITGEILHVDSGAHLLEEIRN